MKIQKYSQPLAVALVVVLASFSFGAQRADAAFIPYLGDVTAADGTVGILIGAPDSLPLPAAGKGGFQDGTNNFESLNINVGAFFFSSLWTGDCTTPGSLTCMTTDPDFQLGSTFVPLLDVLTNTLTFGGSGIPNGGVLIMSSFSVTFGVPLGDITIDETNGTFSLVGDLGNASGVGTFVPVPAAVWLFGSALLGLAGLRRRWSSTQ